MNYLEHKDLLSKMLINANKLAKLGHVDPKIVEVLYALQDAPTKEQISALYAQCKSVISEVENTYLEHPHEYNIRLLYTELLSLISDYLAKVVAQAKITHPLT